MRIERMEGRVGECGKARGRDWESREKVS